ncbi:MAG: GHKL domain-containing protein [Gammaproteobacteria bacterium]|nr:GHKL domain-containing protein [Gammaproteobacteria bacterium]MBQ0839842.1 GHKL domain-containing protein [Gammaproteobacteria bacterium]
MKVGSRIIGPRLGSKLLLAGCVLLLIPWLGLQSLRAMQQFLTEGQAEAQLLTASGIAALLHGRRELFDDNPESTSQLAELPLYPLPGRILLDGFAEDWQGLEQHSKHYGEAPGPTFSLILGENKQRIYGLLKVRDTTPVYRHPAYLRLDHSDHLRIYFKSANNGEGRLLITFEGSGKITAYGVDEDWRIATPGSPDYRLQGHVGIDADGYNIEFSLPLSMLGEQRQLGLAVVDVDDPQRRSIAHISRTFAEINRGDYKQGNYKQGNYNRVFIRSVATEAIIQGLQREEAQIWVFDRALHVRAIAGGLTDQTEDYLNLEDQRSTPLWQSFIDAILGKLVGATSQRLEDFDPLQTLSRDDALLHKAIAGVGSTQRRPSLDGRHEIIAAAQPVRDGDSVIGVVLIEQSTATILSLQRLSLQHIALLSLLSLSAIVIVLLLFSARLTWRITRLGSDTNTASDEWGRMQQRVDIRGTHAGDEIGDLSRNIEQLLARLNRYQQFLSAIPRTLRHEINNPLNTAATSLEHLQTQGGDMTYVDSAQRGLQRISAIVDSLAEAASLEDALSGDEVSPLNLTALITIYVKHLSSRCPHKIELISPEQDVWIEGSDIHIEQLLDKLLDNAIDFSTPGKNIEVSLSTDKNHCFLRVKNYGPVITQAESTELFQLFHSRRKPEQSDSKEQHLGLGLYIARLICERHGGDLGVKNLSSDEGVIFTATLPLTDLEHK